MARLLRPCGTHAAYQRHIRHGEVPCTACTAAHRQYRDEAGYRHHLTRIEQQVSAEADLRKLIAVLAAALGYSP